MYVTQVVKISLKDDAEKKLSHYDYKRVAEWLTQWTPIKNFKAVITDSREDGIAKTRMALRENLVPSWLGVKPEMFSFQVSYQEIDADGRFWMSADAVLLYDYDI